ncbi:hypothetical protein Tco_1343230 [Tanacetum coccineum]
MVGLDFCSKHNMVAYLEKNDGNTEFHQIMDFHTNSSIHFALTVSPIVLTSFVEQFWTSAKSRTVNKISYIYSIVAGKPMTISEASIRSDLIFDDAGGIDTLNNQAIFDTIQLMGYEGDLNILTFNKALFSPQWKFLFHTMNHCISSKSTSWDQIPTNIATTVICLATNQKYNFSKLIFDGMMRHLDASKKFVMYPRFLQIFLKNQLRDVPVPMDHFPVPALTKKVLSFMVKKGKNFSGNVTPLFNSMLVQPTEDEGEVSERPSESQPIPSPTHPSADQPESQPDPSPRPSSPNPIPDSNPEGSGGNHGGQSSSDRSLSGNEDGLTLQSVYDLCISLCTQVTAQAAEIKDLKAQIKQLKKKARPVINHHKACFRAAMLKKQQKKKDMEKPKKRRSVSKQGRKTVKSSKGAPYVQINTDWDALDTNLDETINEAMDYTLAQDEGKTDSKVEEPKTSSKTEELYLSGDTLVVEDKGSVEKGGSTKGTDLQQNTVKPDEGTDKKNGGTDKTKVSTDSFVEGTAEIKDQVSRESDTSTVPTITSTPTPTVFGDDETIAQVLVTMSQNKRPRPTSTRSLLTLKPLPKIDPKAKGKGMIKEEDESDTESEDITEAEKKFNMLANDEEMARKVQEEWEAEEEKKRLAEEEATKAAFTNEYDFIQARLNADKILAEKLQEEEREKFTIEERAKLLHDTIAAQRRFLAQQRSEVIRNRLPSRTQLRNQMMTYLKHVGGKKHSDLKTKIFEEIQVLYEKVKRSDENFIAIGSVEDERLIKDLNKKAAGIKKADSIKKESKEEEGTKKRKLGTRKKMKSRKRRFRQDTSEDENDELRLCLTIAPDEDKEVDYEILDKKYPIIEWKSEHLGIKPQYDETKDLEEINLNVVIRSNGQRRYFSTLVQIPEDFDRVLWGDLMIIFNPSDNNEFWNSQQDWNVYPLRKKVLLQMLELKLESEEDSTMALELIRFVKKFIAELEPENSDGDEEDL